ncbi:MAG: DEAD/DEAH box helicase [Alphaproteobacteria bacterium]|nr:DEAD/DEAH box helicase [Alphaproteobacteria bacterium]
MTNFSKLGIPAIMLDTLKQINFIDPTPIQEQAIPVALEGHDILGSAQTGTGKTASFAIPMIAHLLANKKSSALVLLPTRELAAQVLEATNRMLGNIEKIGSALLIGGDSMIKQLQQLKRNPRIIIGTPGRINDHLSRKTLNISATNFLVLDETDRMLDMGFGVQLNEIAKFLPKERQTLMFSATMPRNITDLSRKYLRQPVRIAVGKENAVANNIRQEIVKTSEGTKYNDLLNQVNTREGSVLIFVKTKFGADRLATRLSKDKLSSGAIHGDLHQRKRERVISDFRNQKFRVLVATDIAARGLDIPHIENVVNYDLPQCPEDYIHRIGRTARAGAEGLAINLLTPKDGAKWKEIYKLMNPSSRDKAMLSDGFSPVDSKPLNSNDSKNAPKSKRPMRAGKRKVELETYGEVETGKRKPKARMTSHNPFNPFAPDKKAVNKQRRERFSKAPKASEYVSYPEFELVENEPKARISAPKAKMSDKKSFKSFASDKNEVKKPRREKFNKNAKSFGSPIRSQNKAKAKRK